MRRIYSLLLYILIPIVLIRLLWRSTKAPDYRKRIKERFGIVPAVECKSGIWLHAASVGEVQASIPLIEHFLHSDPTLTMVITTTTPTGSNRIRELFKSSVYHCYIPYDIPLAVRKFIQTIQPQLAIFIETEVWPNVLYECKVKNIPTLLVNARLSERSARGYARLANFSRITFNLFTKIAAQAEMDAQRFKKLGVNAERLTVVGNIKFDLRLAPNLQEQAAFIKEVWGKERLVWVAASTHDGEESQILAAHREILAVLPNTLLALVPRHPERFNKVGQLILKQGFSLMRRSEMGICTNKYQVFLGDSMGELTMFLAASNVAFIGGSLVPHGGHNVLEAAALGIPVITGHYVTNFITIVNELLRAGAAVQVATASELATVVIKWLQDRQLRENIGDNGRKVVENNRGALDRIINIVKAVNYLNI